ncbi:hypothetical protein [Aquabacterium sp. J223]|uniref:hypothetical protein n=1 Tax=Aquabacterium sp. J223 TaxID=2898431 RepID=UPI0021ADEB8D|nr:hypothetical protein [Aquabacterium sp. J223]UUX96266.1 hypothetical protein LRS07_02745 [Aquabacterium sp. J223]
MSRRPSYPLPRTVAAWLGLLAAAGAMAQAAPATGGDGIYTCVTADGRRLTSDRPIADCTGREQRLLNRDGSLRRVVPPAMSSEERAERELEELRRERERAARADAVRRDRNLVNRYPDEASHQRAREAALDTARGAMRVSENRLRDLTAERKPLLDEAEFYQGKPLPAKLKRALDANDASAEAQRQAIANQQAELERINQLYDVELARLKRLWTERAAGR